MKVFAMLMLRCAFVMLWFSFVQNGTLATLAKWETSFRLLVDGIFTAAENPLDYMSNIGKINQTLDVLLYELNKFPIEGMEKILKRRLKRPLKFAKVYCEKLLDEAHSGLENDKKYLESFLSKSSSITKGIRTEFNTFMFEVELELIKKVKWTSGNKKELAKKFSNLCASAQQIESYCNPESFSPAFLWVAGIGGPSCQPGTKEFVEYLGILILNAKLNILETELRAKIAVFVQQPHIDGDAFIELSERFLDEWNEIKQNTDKLKKKDDKDTLRKKLDDLAEIAMKETAPLKAIMTKKLGQLITKCLNVEQIKNIAISEIPIISESMLSGAVYDVLKNFNEAIDNAIFDLFSTEIYRDFDRESRSVRALPHFKWT